jgi:membrane AbrB-like protein
VIWAAIVLAAVAAALTMQAVAMPAAWMIGPLVVGIAFACAGVQKRIRRSLFVASQAVIGCVFAQAFTPLVLRSLAGHFPVMIAIVCLTVAVSFFCGWLLSRISTLAPLTAAFGSTPGNAAAMVAMCADYGADPRIVAFMQYIRVIFVVMTASLVARFVFHDTATGNPLLAHAMTASLGSLESYAETIAIAVGGVVVARKIRAPSPNIIGPMTLGATLTAFGAVHILTPIWVLDAAYLCIGLSIGLLFTVGALKYAFGILPQIVATTVTLILACALLAAALAKFAHLDMFTAYLATSPGGLDSVAIIALTGGGDVPIVLSLQVVRLFVVALAGPPLARFIARLA